MFIRFAVSNLLSFQKETEFNLFPGRINRLGHHKYKTLGIEALKISAIYGANGAGKSNLVKAINVLRDFVVTGSIPSLFHNQKFKLSEKSALEPIYLGIEFIHNKKPYYYGVHFNDGIILKEDLMYSGLRSNKCQRIFERTSHPDDGSQITFSSTFESSKENLLLKGIIEKDLLKPDKSLLALLNGLTSTNFSEIKSVYQWFAYNLETIYPSSKPLALAQSLDMKKNMFSFANEIMASFQTGIDQIILEKKTVEEFFGKENRREIDQIITGIKESPDKMIRVWNGDEEIVVVEEDGTYIVKRIVLSHANEHGRSISFNLNQESDGTKRLLTYIPAIQEIISREKIYFIDEIERSIHPLLIKELIRKFSEDGSTKGQLIFTTHDSNLLDQDIFRQDEIWFAEKNRGGATELYPLTEFKKEHHTIDLRKGYLTGRYGAIPFLGNLSDLKWNHYAAN